jgi:hypothetical protein
MPKQTRATDTQEQQSSARRKTQPAPSVQAPAGAHLQRLPENPAAASPADVAQLQNRYGNRAVQRLLSQHTIQAKLEVGPANDHYEQEADRVAQTVMRMGDTSAQEEDEVQSE